MSTRRDGVITDTVTGQDLNQIGTQAVRGQLLFKPDDALQLRLIGDFTNFQARCCTQVFLRVGQSLRAANRQYPALAAGLGYTPASTDPYDRVTNIDGQLDSDTNERGLEAQMSAPGAGGTGTRRTTATIPASRSRPHSTSRRARTSTARRSASLPTVIIA